MSDSTNPVPSEASNRALFSDSMNRWRVPVKMGAGGAGEQGQETRERADSEGRVQQNQNHMAAHRIQQQQQDQQAQQQVPQRVVNVPSSVLAAYQGKPQQIPPDRLDERRRSESNIERSDVPPTFFMYDSTGRTFEPSNHQQAALPQWQQRGRQRYQQQQQQPQQQQPPQPHPQQPQPHQPSQSHVHSPPAPSRRASSQATPTQSSVSIASANQNIHHNILASPVALRRVPSTCTATPASTSNIDINAAPTPHPHPHSHPATTATPCPTTTTTTATAATTSTHPRPPAHPAHPIVIQNAAKALSPIRHLYETAWSQTVLSVQSEMARMHGELVGVIEHERGLHAELEGEYVRVREERERVAEEARRMGREVEEARRGAWVVGRELERARAEMERMRAEVEGVRMAQGQGRGEGERERAVREELEDVRMQLAEKAKELEVERVLRYNAERKLRDVQTVTARIFSTPETESETSDLRMQVDTTLDTRTNTNTNTNTRRGSESASTVVGTPDSDRSPSLKQGHYRPQAQYEHLSHDQHQHQHQHQYQQAENYDHEEVGSDRDRARTNHLPGSSARSMSVSSPMATRSPPTPIIGASLHLHAPEPQPHPLPQSHTRPEPIPIAPPPAESPVREDSSAPVPVPVSAQVHAHALQKGANARSQPHPHPHVVTQQPWHRPQAVPVHTLEEDEEVDERGERREAVPMPGYGNVLVSRGAHPPPPLPPLSAPGQDEKAGVIDLRSPLSPQPPPQPRPQSRPQVQTQPMVPTLTPALAPALRVAIPPPIPSPVPPSCPQSPVTSTPRSASLVVPTPSQPSARGQSPPPMARLSRPVSPEQRSSTQPPAQPAFLHAQGSEQGQRPAGARTSQDIPLAPPPPPWSLQKVVSMTPGAVEESTVGGRSRQGSVDAQAQTQAHVRRPSVPPTAQQQQQQGREYIPPTPPPPPWVAQNLSTTPTTMQMKPNAVEDGVASSRPGSAVQRPSPRVQSQPGLQIVQQEQYSPQAGLAPLAPQHFARTSTSTPAVTDVAPTTLGSVLSRPGSSAQRPPPNVEAPAPAPAPTQAQPEPQRPSPPAIIQQYIPHPPPPPPWLPQNASISTIPAPAPPMNTTMNAAQPIPTVPPFLPPPTGPFAHYVWPPRTPVEAPPQAQAPAPDSRSTLARRPATVPVPQPLPPPRRAFTVPNAPRSALESSKGTVDTGTPVVTRKRDRQEYEGDGENLAAVAGVAAGEEQQVGRGRGSIVRSWTEPNGERTRQRMRVKLEDGEISEEPESESAGAREGAKEFGVAGRPSAEGGKGERKIKLGASAKTPVRNNKIGINHLDLLYETRGAQLHCRMCRSGDNVELGMKPMSFPVKATWPELVGHCQMAHPKSCEDLERLSPSQVAELRQRLTSSKMTGFVLR